MAADDPCLTAPVSPGDGVTLLFAGTARVEKGLATLLRAARHVEGFDRLVVPGRIAPAALAGLDLSDPRLERWDRWLEPDEYFATMQAASVVVLPYRGKYLRHGIYSSVMGEAMARGRPLVLTPALGHLLPRGYAGAVVAADESDDALAAALREAVARQPELEVAAMTAGREHVRTHHTFEGYLDGVIRAGTR